MRPRRSHLRWKLTVLASVLAVAAFPPTSTAVTRAAMPATGLICTTDASESATNQNANFSLTATTGYVNTPDGNSIFMWSFAPTNGAFQYPGPNLCVNQGDTVNITLTNTLSEDASIAFPGQDNVLANGGPAEPQYDGSGNLTSLTQVAPARGGSATYTFVASQPGTYIYESGTDPGKQIQMGLFGALIVRPTGAGAQPNWAYNSSRTVYKPGQEYEILLSEIDPFLHQAVERGQPYDITTYHPRYWMINGRAFPDTIAPNGAAWLPNQPYGALVHIQVNTASNPLPALVRYLNVGRLNHPFHPHGQNHRIIARDGRLLQGSGGQDLSYEKFSILVGSGQTWDATVIFHDKEGWSPTNPLPVAVPGNQSLTFKDNATWYSGSPYLGSRGDLPIGVTMYNQCGEFYHVWHSHALNEAANFEQGFGGMFTLERIDPPPPNQCQ